MNDEALDELERQIHDQIRFHREQYEKAIKPLLDRLTQIRSLRPQVLVLSRDQLSSFALEPFGPAPSLQSRGDSNAK